MLQKMNTTTRPQRKFFARKHEVIDLPPLTEIQIDSYNWFLKEGILELFAEISPIRDFTEKKFELNFVDFIIDEPKMDEATSKSKNATFESAVKAKVQLVNKETGEAKEQEIYLGEFPLMTDRGTFVVNGVERVVVSQLIRSPGVIFTSDVMKDGDLSFGAKVIPNRGAWLEFETDRNGVISVKIDRKRKVPATSLMKAFGLGTDEEIKKMFADVDTLPDKKFIANTLEKDDAKTEDDGMIEVYKRIRPGDLATADNARSLIEAMFFDFDRYDFGKVGRFKANQRLGIDIPINNFKKKIVFFLIVLSSFLFVLLRLGIPQNISGIWHPCISFY